MKLALYARNSKPPRGWKPTTPNEQPPGSWQTQLVSLHRWAEREGHIVILEDHDSKSGGDPNRDAWHRLMQEARGHHIDAIAVTKLDRAMRSASHFHQVADELLSLGVDLIVVETGMRVSKRDAMSKAFMAISAAFAELELDLIRERTNDVMERRDDGRLYGPRSANPVGRAQQYTAAEGHKMRMRHGRLAHDKAKCAKCRGAKEGAIATPPTDPN